MNENIKNTEIHKKLSTIDQFLKYLRIPREDCQSYVNKLSLLGYEDIRSIIEDIDEGELIKIGMKPGHIKRVLKELNKRQTIIKQVDQVLSIPDSYDFRTWLCNNPTVWLKDILQDHPMLNECIKCFDRNQIGSTRLLELYTEDDLLDLGIPQGDHLEKILTNIELLRQKNKEETIDNNIVSIAPKKSLELLSKYPIKNNSLDNDSYQKLMLNMHTDMLKPLSTVEEFNICPQGNANLGGFKICAYGINAIPESVTPLEKMSCVDVPRFTREATIIFDEIGRGGSAIVYKGLYVPTLTFLAIKNVEVKDSSKRKQMISELKTLYTISRQPFSIKTKAIVTSPLISRNSNDKLTTLTLSDVNSDSLTPLASHSTILNEKTNSSIISNTSDIREYKNKSMNAFIKVIIPTLLMVALFINIGLFALDLIFVAIASLVLILSFIMLIVLIIKRTTSNNSRNTLTIDSYTSDDNIDSIIDSNPIVLNNCIKNRYNSFYKTESDEKDLSSCPYIISFFDAYTDVEKGKICIALEYMEEGSLQKYVENHKALDEEDLAVVAYSVLRALEALHSRNIIHRDIKPANILCDIDGHVKLSDFGIMKELSEQTSADTFTGTLHYMSPERIKTDKYSYASDIWSVGVTLIALANGDIPFPLAKGYWGLYDAIQNSMNATFLDETKHSKELCDFVKCCVKMNPNDRADVKTLLKHPLFNVINFKPSEHPTIKIDHVNEMSSVQIDHIIDKILEWAIVHTDIECLGDYFRIKLKLFSTCNFIEKLLDENWRPNYSFDKLEWLARQMNCRVEHLVSRYSEKKKFIDNVMDIIIRELIVRLHNTNPALLINKCIRKLSYHSESSPNNSKQCDGYDTGSATTPRNNTPTTPINNNIGICAIIINATLAILKGYPLDAAIRKIRQRDYNFDATFDILTKNNSPRFGTKPITALTPLSTLKAKVIVQPDNDNNYYESSPPQMNNETPALNMSKLQSNINKNETPFKSDESVSLLSDSGNNASSCLSHGHENRSDSYYNRNVQPANGPHGNDTTVTFLEKEQKHKNVNAYRRNRSQSFDAIGSLRKCNEDSLIDRRRLPFKIITKPKRDYTTCPVGPNYYSGPTSYKIHRCKSYSSLFSPSEEDKDLNCCSIVTHPRYNDYLSTSSECSNDANKKDSFSDDSFLQYSLNSSNVFSLDNSEASEDLKINTILNKKTQLDSNIILPTGIPTNKPSIKIIDVVQSSSMSPNSSDFGDTNERDESIVNQVKGMTESPKSLSEESLIVVQDNYDNFQESFSPSSNLDELEDIDNPVF